MGKEKKRFLVEFVKTSSLTRLFLLRSFGGGKAHISPPREMKRVRMSGGGFDDEKKRKKKKTKKSDSSTDNNLSLIHI